ncbi:MAG: H/ACA RNA-protein complex component Cbf5p [Methanosaeta sp. PtaB.Bin039]|nr:MAG: H/ACA RNA-protein complex component Cbf5p [Methanosaeta sp. PtaB.Bin039]OPY44227.1 MAG: H/ACA RNA-protein complex component Cbf5p [Methanosaeta sp. PtaU1.Bin028]HOT07242.1 RNA-binding protein [Methanotrichaceae archaeon]HQF17270.1 RNA-binding protein [Methanotrichaceae archaeon]HQI91843.1 RNA-binding protein [Methanotrichaceae archaeon]
MKIKSRHHLKGSEAKRIFASIEPLLEDVSTLRDAHLERAVSDEGMDLIFVNGKPFLMVLDSQPFFTVLGAMELRPKKRLVVVDSGAIRFVANGADIMNPGIVTADPEIKEGDLVVITEEKHGKPLAIGRALIPADQMKGEGKAVKSLHHVGDQIWKGVE